jgi:hypothetical protein
MKSIEKFKSMLEETPKSKVIQSSNHIWMWEASSDQNSKLCVKIEKDGKCKKSRGGFHMIVPKKGGGHSAISKMRR